MTLPLIHALRESPASERRRILKLVRRSKKTPEDVRLVTAFVQARGGLDYAREQMLALAEEALQLLLTFPDSEARRALVDLTAYTVQRKV